VWTLLFPWKEGHLLVIQSLCDWGGEYRGRVRGKAFPIHSLPRGKPSVRGVGEVPREKGKGGLTPFIPSLQVREGRIFDAISRWNTRRIGQTKKRKKKKGTPNLFLKAK